MISARGTVKGWLKIKRFTIFFFHGILISHIHHVFSVTYTITIAFTSGFQGIYHRAVHSMSVLGKGEWHCI